MIQGSKEEQYLKERWQSQRDYYSKASQKNKRWHQSLLLVSSIGAILIPVLLNIPAIPTWLPTVISSLVAIALSLDNTLHFGDNWRSFRQTLEALKQERIFFENGVKPYADPQIAFPWFVQRCEEIIGTEEKRYFEIHKSQKQTVENKSS